VECCSLGGHPPADSCLHDAVHFHMLDSTCELILFRLPPRLAMMGFLVSVLEEFWTGKGTLQQIGLETPSLPALIAISTLTGFATLWATSQTLVKAQTGQLEPR